MTGEEQQATIFQAREQDWKQSQNTCFLTPNQKDNEQNAFPIFWSEYLLKKGDYGWPPFHLHYYGLNNELLSYISEVIHFVTCSGEISF